MGKVLRKTFTSVEKTLAEKVDEYAVLAAKVKPLARQLEKLRKELLKEAPKGAKGLRYGFDVSVTPAEILDSDKIHADMSAAWLKKYKKTIEKRTIVVFKL